MRTKLLQKIKVKLFGPPSNERKTGSILSSAAAEPDHHPKIRSVGSSIKLDVEPKHRRPHGDGWQWRNGMWVRPVRSSKRCGHGRSEECDCGADDTEPKRGSLTIGNSFE